jgi:hypothetical protein
MSKTLIAAMALATLPSLSTAYTGNELHQGLQNNEKGAQGFVIGVWIGADGHHFCSPEGVRGGQVVDIVRADLADASKARHHNAGNLIKVFLGNLWPCPKKQAAPVRSY